jgi:hypothetical protein
VWIHILTQRLVKGASPVSQPEPPVNTPISAGGWVEWKKFPKRPDELLITGAPQTVVKAKALPQRIALPPAPTVDKVAVQAMSTAVEVVRQAAVQYNATIQRQRKEEEELLLMF